MLTDIFKFYCPNAIVWAYGSRINGKAHDGSDLDLVVRDFGAKDLKLSKLRELINDSNIPFLVDINEFDKLPDYFKTEILKDYVEIYNKKC